MEPLKDKEVRDKDKDTKDIKDDKKDKLRSRKRSESPVATKE